MTTYGKVSCSAYVVVGEDRIQQGRVRGEKGMDRNAENRVAGKCIMVVGYSHPSIYS